MCPSNYPHQNLVPWRGQWGHPPVVSNSRILLSLGSAEIYKEEPPCLTNPEPFDISRNPKRGFPRMCSWIAQCPQASHHEEAASIRSIRLPGSEFSSYPLTLQTPQATGGSKTPCFHRFQEAVLPVSMVMTPPNLVPSL